VKKVAVDKGQLEAFLRRKYVTHADKRQEEMGLEYLTAEVRDLAKEVARFVNGGDAPFREGELVHKVGGDYTWSGDVRCCYTKRNGLWRVVSENDQGLNHIFSPTQLQRGLL
jgi:hypothetical protein